MKRKIVKVLSLVLSMVMVFTSMCEVFAEGTAVPSISFENAIFGGAEGTDSTNNMLDLITNSKYAFVRYQNKIEIFDIQNSAPQYMTEIAASFNEVVTDITSFSLVGNYLLVGYKKNDAAQPYVASYDVSDVTKNETLSSIAQYHLNAKSAAGKTFSTFDYKIQPCGDRVFIFTTRVSNGISLKLDDDGNFADAKAFEVASLSVEGCVASHLYPGYTDGTYWYYAVNKEQNTTSPYSGTLLLVIAEADSDGLPNIIGTVKLIDISDSTAKLNFNVGDITKSGNYIYLTMANNCTNSIGKSSIIRVDVTNPTMPVKDFELFMAGTTGRNTAMQGIEIKDGYLFVYKTGYASSGQPSLRMYDISLMEANVAEGNDSIPDFSKCINYNTIDSTFQKTIPTYTSNVDLEIVGNSLYLVCLNNGLQKYSLTGFSEPVAPTVPQIEYYGESETETISTIQDSMTAKVTKSASDSYSNLVIFAVYREVNGCKMLYNVGVGTFDEENVAEAVIDGKDEITQDNISEFSAKVFVWNKTSVYGICDVFGE